jgi:hypothetical protein
MQKKLKCEQNRTDALSNSVYAVRTIDSLALEERRIMVHQFRPSFPHRLNADGTYHSICTLCRVIVTAAKSEAELARHEQSHECNPIRLYQLSQFRPGAHAIAL